MDKSPDLADTLIARAELHCRIAEFDDAERDLRRAFELADESDLCAKILMLLAHVLIENRKFDAAVQTLVDLIGDVQEMQNKSRYDAFMLLALAHEGRGDYKRAGVAYRLALRENPDGYEARYKQAINVGLSENRWRETHAVLTQLCDAAPKDYNAWFFQGIALTWLEDFVGAEKALTWAHGLAPDLPEPIFQLARVMNNIKRYKRAEDLLVKLDTMNISHWTGPERAAILNQKAVALCGQVRLGTCA